MTLAPELPAHHQLDLPVALLHRHPRSLEILGLWLLADPHEDPKPFYDHPDPFWQQTAQRDMNQRGPDPTWQDWFEQLCWRTPVDAWYSLKAGHPHESGPEALARFRAEDHDLERQARRS